MIQTRLALRARRSVPIAALVAALLGGLLPLPGVAAGPGDAGSGIAARPATAAADPAADPNAADPAADPNAAAAADPAAGPSTVYEQAMVHAADRITFEPGSRVTVGFTPRANDQWPVGGHAPTSLPAGRATGRDMAASTQGSGWAVLGAGDRRRGTQAPAATPDSTATPAPVDASSNAAAVDAHAVAWQAPAASTAVEPAVASGLRRQVFGFLPYWELSGASSKLNYAVLSTIAYFSVGADRLGNLLKRNSNGSTTTGWGGWTSSSMTSVINEAHARGTRVVLTSSVFAWSTGGASVQRAILGSSTARLNLARQLAAAVRDRGADGVNLDFEPLVSGYETQFVAFLKTLRSQLNAIRSGYQITYDTTGYIGNYPLAASVGSTAADAIFIMGYDYRTAGSSTTGSVDPLSGPAYDLADTVRAYTARVSPSRVILGIPWYGRAWSTTSDQPRSPNQSGARYGYSTSVNYENMPALVAQYGRRWDPVEQSPYVAYRRQNCTTTYGCVTSWRQVWYDDAASMGLRYGLVNSYGLRGAGMWALGYEGSYPALYKALSDAFLVDHAAPQAGVRNLSAVQTDEGFPVSWAAADVSAVRTYDVQVSTDGGAWVPWLTATTLTTDVWLGTDRHGYAFRVRATDSHGNTGAWNVTANGSAAPALVVGGFGRVTLDGLAYRTGPSTSAAQLGTLPVNTIVALTSGPVSSGGYTWFEVTQPIREWAPVSFVERGVWIAIRSSTASYLAAYHAPNAVAVNAGITRLDFAGGGATGASAAASRTFSPNGDGARDALAVRWTNTLAMPSMTLNVYRADGSLAGSEAMPGLTAAAHVWTWNGRIGGTRLPDGRYVLQLVGTAGTRSYRAPSSRPATPRQLAMFGVTIDTVPPVIGSATTSTSAISPNGDGTRDSVTYRLSAPGATRWTIRIAAGSAAPVRSAGAAGGTATFTWKGTNDAGAVVPNGRYAATLAACDVAGNCATRAFAITVDTTRPVITPSAAPAAFSPNGDGSADTVALRWTANEKATGTARVWRGTTLVRSWTFSGVTGGAITWNGRTAAGTAVADGRYTFKVDARDAVGNRTVVATPVVVDRTAGFLRWSRPFYPQDGDALVPTSTLRWTLARSATTTLAIYDAKGTLVRTVWTGRVQSAGARSWTWDGKLANGTRAPQGRYTARLTVTSPYSRQVLVSAVWATAFVPKLSATTVSAGRVLTVAFTSVEPLSTRPTVTFAQPGLAAVTVAATKLADGSWRAQLTVRAGAAGAGSIRIAAKDSAGHVNATVVAIAVAS